MLGHCICHTGAACNRQTSSSINGCNDLYRKPRIQTRTKPFGKDNTGLFTWAGPSLQLVKNSEVVRRFLQLREANISKRKRMDKHPADWEHQSTANFRLFTTAMVDAKLSCL